jgi:hypothetical protein
MLLPTLLGLLACVRPPTVPSEVSGEVQSEALPAPEALFAAHLAALGGEAAVRGRGASEARGEAEFVGQGLTAPFAVWQAPPDRYRYLLSLSPDAARAAPEGPRLERGYDGAVGWARNPGARLLGGTELAALARRADLDGEADYGRWVSAAETAGRMRFRGQDAWEVEVTWVEGTRGQLWFSPESGLALGERTWPDTAGEPTLTVYEGWSEGAPRALDAWRVVREDLEIAYRVRERLPSPAPPDFGPPEDLAGLLWRPEAAPAAALPLEESPGGALVVRLWFGDREARFLVDSGANASLVDDDLALALGAGGPGLDLGGEAAGGDLAAMRVRDLPAFTLGGRAYPGLGVLEIDLEALGVDGLLGNDFLSLHTLEIDPAAGALRLHPRGGAGAGAPAVAGLAAVPLEGFSEGLLRAQVRLDGGPPFPALVDLGAVRSLVSRPAASAAAARPGFGGFEAAGSLEGVDGASLPVSVATFQQLRAGEHAWEAPALHVANLPGLDYLFGRRSSALLGLDLLRAQRMVLDPEGPTLYLGGE